MTKTAQIRQRIREEETRQKNTKNRFIWECAQQEIERLGRELEVLENACGNGGTDEPAPDLGIGRIREQESRRDSNRNPFIKKCAHQEIERLMAERNARTREAMGIEQMADMMLTKPKREAQG